MLPLETLTLHVLCLTEGESHRIYALSEDSLTRRTIVSPSYFLILTPMSPEVSQQPQNCGVDVTTLGPPNPLIVSITIRVQFLEDRKIQRDLTSMQSAAEVL